MRSSAIRRKVTAIQESTSSQTFDAFSSVCDIDSNARLQRGRAWETSSHAMPSGRPPVCRQEVDMWGMVLDSLEPTQDFYHRIGSLG